VPDGEEDTLAHEIRRVSISIWLVFGLAIAFCNLSAAAQHASTTAFIHVNVVPMDREIVLRDQTVVVKDGKIVALGPTRSIKLPKGSQRIEGSNQYLMPGLADMHIHFIRPATAKKQPSSADTYAQENPRLALLFVANGVTTVRNMWGHPAIRALNDDIHKGRLIGPTIYSVGPVTDGDPPTFAGMRIVTTDEQARQAVREDKEAGYIGIKVYNRLSPSAYKAIVAEAAEQRLPVMGHVPRAVGLAGAIEAHQKSLEHFSSFMRAALPDGMMQADLSMEEILTRADLNKLPTIAEAVAAAGSWVCPTVVQVQMDSDPKLWEKERSFVPSGVVDRYKESGKLIPFPPQGPAAKPFALALVRALHEKRAGLLAGTDAYKLNVIPGFSLLQELKYFVEAGLSPYEAIKAGTRDAARFLNQENEFGTVAVGRRAELILLSANPLDDVGNVAKRTGVMLRGEWLTEEKLQRRLRDSIGEQAAVSGHLLGR
jgi:imidazolonepropionase-like amidohydrolase